MDNSTIDWRRLAESALILFENEHSGRCINRRGDNGLVPCTWCEWRTRVKEANDAR